MSKLKQILEKIKPSNDLLEKDFRKYLIDTNESFEDCLRGIIKGDIEKYVNQIYEMAFYYSFVFGAKIQLSQFFDEDDVATLHCLFAEIYQSILGIYGCLKLGSVLGAYPLLRSILHRVTILEIIFENHKNGDQIKDRLKKYRNLGGVLAYQYFDKVGNKEKEKKKEFEDHFTAYADGFRTDRNTYDYTQAIYGKKKTISQLLKKFGLDNEHNALYGDLSVVDHGHIAFSSLLNKKLCILPFEEVKEYRKICGCVAYFLAHSIYGVVSYINNPDNDPILTFIQNMAYDLASSEEVRS
ncbi:hypothetical protein AGMMS50249_3880 [candidate division SR1 bacterium]|nr:hypothetical protein AGMMS50249_3880 [candidate division SR1 bacterium]